MPGSHDASDLPPTVPDPIYGHARHELKVSLAAWFLFGVWVLGFSWWQGQAPALEVSEMKLVLGMPAWVFWGVAVPWVLANVFTFWFCFACMKDASLQVVAAETEPEPSPNNPPHPNSK